MSLTRTEAREIVDRVLKLAKADETTVSINGDRDANLRFARNEVTTSGDVDNVTLNVRSSFGKRSGGAQTNQFDNESLERVTRRAEEIARFAPEDPEHMTLLGEQTYADLPAFDAATAEASPDYRANIAAKAIDMAKKKDVTIAGFLTNGASFSALGNSKGLFAYHSATSVTFSNTARTNDATGSGWAGGNAEKTSAIDPLALAQTAVEKAFLSRKPKEMPPGTYPVILEPAAVADLLLFLAFAVDARSADEGRSFFAKQGGGTKIGEKIVSDRISIWTDPSDPRAIGRPYASDGLPTRKTSLVENGVVKNLSYSRYWAEKMKKEPTPFPSNLIMKGESGTLSDLIRKTKDALLVTRLHYIRSVDPQTILLTGLTRDGVFKIRNGKIANAVKNFRWNDSPVAVFSKVEMMTKEMRTRGSEAEDFSIVCPAIRTQFTFTSLSEAV